MGIKFQTKIKKNKQEVNKMVLEKDYDATEGLIVEFVGLLPGNVKEWYVSLDKEKRKSWSYRVREIPEKGYECDCMDYYYGGKKCRHIKAVMRSLEKGCD